MKIWGCGHFWPPRRPKDCPFSIPAGVPFVPSFADLRFPPFRQTPRRLVPAARRSRLHRSGDETTNSEPQSTGFVKLRLAPFAVLSGLRREPVVWTACGSFRCTRPPSTLPVPLSAAALNTSGIPSLTLPLPPIRLVRSFIASP